ncbi:MAG: hypothetical protein KAR13_13290 [Desulfobulbaceae bacterium]|nr:hypothetical protein [Desulfobulbaceae bacterium]
MFKMAYPAIWQRSALRYAEFFLTVIKHLPFGMELGLEARAEILHTSAIEGQKTTDPESGQRAKCQL